MLTIKELYQKALKESTGNEDFKYDPSQLNCLFEPKEYPINWKLSDILTPAGIPLSGTTITKDTLAVLNALASHKGKRAFILIAPAFLGQFSDQVSPGMIRTAFKKIGFNGLIEVAVFADILTLREALEFDHNIHSHNDYQLTSCCCPMWIAMIKKLYTDLMPHVPATVSPMIAAGRTVKILHPDALTVFVGPCMAKKAEAREKDIAGAVDYVLTFQETKELFKLLNVNLTQMEDNVKEFSSKAGRIYARTGGVSEAVKSTLARLSPNRDIAIRSQQADGVPACKKMITDLMEGKTQANFFEGMGCIGGCVGGPKSLLEPDKARDKVNQYGDKAIYETPLDNPYVLELLYRLNFTTLESLMSDNEFFTRKF